MILRRLEVYGFKSFADRQVLSFAPGITAIIGPNGCGKSNVVDAFKWILGEQAPSSIRSKGMSDVLHLDREGKEAVAYAEGSITFDNATELLNYDAPEVVVTRRIHGDGRSEYLINNNVVRLRTLRDLFTGTGIGTRSYFVLEQGRITEIIKRSPTERRAIFEEAAGIGRYNQRRREAERKLAGVEDSLNRARDVISEISRQIRSLRIQAGRARSYNETSARLREVRIRAGTIRYHVINRDLDGIAERIAAEAGEEECARDAERRAIRLREASQALRQRCQEAVHRYRALHQANAAKVDGWREKIATDTEEAARCRNEVEIKATEATRIEVGLEETRRELASLDRRHQDAIRARRVFTDLRLLKAEEYEDARDAHQASETELEALRQESYEKDRERAHLMNRLGTLRIERGSLEGSLDRLRRRGHELTAQLARVASDRETAEARSAELTSTLADARSDLDRAAEEQEAARRRFLDLERRIAELRVNLKELEGRLEVLRDLEASHEGMGEGARFLLDGADAPGIVGLLGESFDVRPEHARAIERVLGEDVEALLTGQVNDALSAADTLARSGKGGAHFWPLDNRDGSPGGPARPDGLPQDQPGVVGWAPELLVPRRPENASVLALLRDVIVVEDRETAIRLREQGLTERFRLVTVTGEVYGPANRIVAGESVQSGGLISRRVEIERVDGEIRDMNRELTNLEERREAAQDAVDQADRAVAVARERLRDRDVDRARQVKEVDDIRRRERDLEEEKRIGEEEAAEMGRDLDTLMSEERSLEESAHDLEQRLEQIKKHEHWLETLRSGARRRLGWIKSEAERVEAVAGGARRHEAELQSVKHQVLERISEMDHNLSRLRAEADSLRDRAGRCDAAVVENEQRIQDADAERIRWDSLLDQAGRELESADESLEEATREQEEARRALESVQSAREEDRIRQGELRTRLESLIERLKEEEDIDLEEATSDPAVREEGGSEGGNGLQRTTDQRHSRPPSSPDSAPTAGDESELETLEGEAAQLKRKLDRLGPVNAAAIQELKELEKREAFYLAQENDLIESKKTLEDIIRRINRRSRQIFLETFNTVRAEFRAIFRKLFGGGRGDVRLLDEENVLESGVEIVAQPPEKGAKSLDMLSGGEKVMTTTALLFAIFRARPCPFCLLDEVDAALDEANIQRFLEMVNDFLETTQFIIVTHNKRTIAQADVIHGITMPKAGRSQRVSVKFEDGEVRPVDRSVPVFALENV